MDNGARSPGTGKNMPREASLEPFRHGSPIKLAACELCDSKGLCIHYQPIYFELPSAPQRVYLKAGCLYPSSFSLPCCNLASLFPLSLAAFSQRMYKILPNVKIKLIPIAPILIA